MTGRQQQWVRTHANATCLKIVLEATNLIKRGARRTFSKETLLKRIPITKWLPNYKLEYLGGDVMAGFTVGLTVIPQGIAYAAVAGLPANLNLYGLYRLMGCFVYMIFGSCKDITIGPTAIMAIMTHEYSGSAVLKMLCCCVSSVVS
ncbi:Sodium-independent sulfate anion transporter-like 1 [Homarus americanus]|uniref:Sodium-independent sulfate anion transporter-like 1 n=1 Tax=Homarus americanus TaxID=6706 RepID=A0A8J5N5N4_HOMAM|nr:Sodium-independent sulfate anion transporter-like 1 [Homarus americanus]